MADERAAEGGEEGAAHFERRTTNNALQTRAAPHRAAAGDIDNFFIIITGHRT